jgi:hypothetical protein
MGAPDTFLCFHYLRKIEKSNGVIPVFCGKSPPISIHPVNPNPPSKKANHRAHREFLCDLKKLQHETKYKSFTKRVHGV